MEARRDVVERIVRFNAGREPERLARKYLAMRANPFAFFRGTAHLFWDDWAAAAPALDGAPAAWSCGDAHLENFGCYRGDNRLAYFDLNDFDEAALAPATRDPARFLTSVRVASGALGLSASDATALCRVFLSSYVAALGDGKARWVERATAKGMVRELLHGVKRRTREALLDSHTESDGVRRRIRVDGRHALALSGDDRDAVSECFRSLADAQEDPKFYKVLDIARRAAGTGSLGVRRFIILVRGRGSPNGNVLLNVKEATPSSLVPSLAARQPTWRSEAERVVTLHRRMQAIAPALLHAVRMGDRHFVVRELQPSEDRLALEHWHGRLGRLRRVMATMGHVVAWAQLRSASRQGAAGVDDLIAFARERTWRRPLHEYAAEYATRVERDWKRFARSRVVAAKPAGAPGS